MTTQDTLRPLTKSITTRLSCAALVLLGTLAMSTSSHASPTSPELIGQWTFEPGSETVDASGHWGPLQLHGNATISDGQLHVHAAGYTPAGWAHALTYDGSTIREKTLVSWVSVNNLHSRFGSAMTIDNISGDNFDAIVYAERHANRWMAGSSYFRRTQDVVMFNETIANEVLQMAISYRDLGAGQVEITLCREGQQIGQYISGNMTQWYGPNAEILFGMRHSHGLNGPGGLEGSIEEARIYDGAMTCGEVAGLQIRPDADGDGVPDELDVCPGYDDNLDGDEDGVPNGCDLCIGDDSSFDDDDDGVCEDLDLCFGDDASGDFDGDFVCDDTDNCTMTSNPDQADSDLDGTGDLCDDGDGDGVLDLEDNCPATANPDQADSDLDTLGDACDDDDDDDGVLDEFDNCVLVANAGQLDFDEDGQGDSCDGDDDNDGVLDEDDSCPATPMDQLFDANGCSGVQHVELSCGSCSDYPNEGKFVSCVAQASTEARKSGLLTNKERASVVRSAARSSCG